MAASAKSYASELLRRQFMGECTPRCAARVWRHLVQAQHGACDVRARRRRRSAFGIPCVVQLRLFSARVAHHRPSITLAAAVCVPSQARADHAPPCIATHTCACAFPHDATGASSRRADMSKAPPEGISVGLKDDNLFTWEIMIVGPPSTY